MCSQNCRTFTWGGAGVPVHDNDGVCFCVCEDDSWSNLNILGLASCIPVKAYVIFGWVGLAFSMAALSHAAYHFQRQLWFHAQHITASTSYPEQCRRKLRKSVIASSTTAAGYFCMVLTQQLRWSFAVLAIVHMGVALSGLCITRMWMYTQDPRLMQESSEMLAFVSFLERPTGHTAACCVVMSTPGVGVLLALLRKPGTAVKILIAGAAALSLLVAVVFWVCGRSLMRAIDKSLQAHQDAMATEVAGQPSKRSGGDLALLGSRKKTKSLIIFVVLQVVVFDPALLFSVFSRYGEEAPLLLFGVVLGIMPPIWLMVGVQIFAGRSRVRRSERHMARGIQGTGR